MKLNFKNQNLLFTLDQILDSGLVFLFIALGGLLLTKNAMADVVLAQSTALVCVLFCSCFTSQYLLLKFKNQPSKFWAVIFLVFFFIVIAIISCSLKSYEISLLFAAGIFSEFIKRYSYYQELSFPSFCATASTSFGFLSILAFLYSTNVSVDDKIYIYLYVFAKLLPLIGVVIYMLFVKRKDSSGFNMQDISFAFLDSLKCGSVFAAITIIYWVTNQGFFVLMQNTIPASELVEIRVTQNVFGIVTMLITLYDSVFLKKNIKSDVKIFSGGSYLSFAVMATILIVVNYLFLYVLSLTVYIHIDVLKYSVFLALAQWFYLLSRMPILIIKLRYSLIAILTVYVVSLIVSSIYLLINQDDSSYLYVVEAIALANFTTFIFSFFIVIIKERGYEQVN